MLFWGVVFEVLILRFASYVKRMGKHSILIYILEQFLKCKNYLFYEKSSEMTAVLIVLLLHFYLFLFGYVLREMVLKV